jgi:hypothetical protein
MNDNTRHERKTTKYLSIGFTRVEGQRVEVWVVYRPVAIVEYYVREIGFEYAPSGLPYGLKLAPPGVVLAARKALGLIKTQAYAEVPFELLDEKERHTVEI